MNVIIGGEKEMMTEIPFEIVQNNSKMWTSLGMELLQSLGLKDESTECFRKSLELDPQNITSLDMMAHAVNSKENRQEAFDFWDKILEIDPDNAEAWKSKGFFLALWENDSLAAMDCLQKVISLIPNDPWQYYYPVMVLSDSGKENQALDLVNIGLKFEPNFRPLLYCKILILENLGKHQEQFELCDLILKRIDEENDKHETARHYFLKGNALANLKKFKEALISYDTSYRYRERTFGDYRNKKRVLDAIKTGRVSDIPFRQNQEGRKNHFSLIYPEDYKND
jgi:tetratricopeptide (TPR) repeat protein